jgi:acyl carrier protein
MAADATQIRAVVRAFILDRFYVPDPGRLADDASLLDAGVVDSTGVQEVIGFLEGEFGIRVENDEIIPEHLDSVDRLTRFVRHKVDVLRASPDSTPGSPRLFGE